MGPSRTMIARCRLPLLLIVSATVMAAQGCISVDTALGPSPPEPAFTGTVAARPQGHIRRQLYYGNYCGRGSNGRGARPIDGLDAACMRHDTCWERRGDYSCSCDRILVREALAIADDDRFSRDVRGKAGAIAAAMQVLACDMP